MTGSSKHESKTLPEYVLAIINLFEHNDIRVVVGGALAAVYYMPPRLTTDVDINVSCDEQHSSRPLDLLSDQLHAQVTHRHRETSKQDGQAIGIDLGNNIRLDIFFHIGQFSDFIFDNSRRVQFGGEEISIMSPEGIIACKAIFNRAKDWLDINNILLDTPLDAGKLKEVLCDIAHMDDCYQQIMKMVKQIDTFELDVVARQKDF